MYHILCTHSPVDVHFLFQFGAVGNKAALIIPVHGFDGHGLTFLLGIDIGFQMPVCAWDDPLSKTGTQ